MNIEIVKAHFELFAICEYQNDVTGNWIYALRRVPDHHADDGGLYIRVDNKQYNIDRLVKDFRENEQ